MRSKAFSFLLSLSLMFCVGFGSSLHAYAFSPTDNLIPINSVGYCRILDSRSSNLVTVYEGLNITPDSSNIYVYKNSKVSGNDLRLNLNLGTNDFYSFPFDPLNYDYYFISTVMGYCSNGISDFTFYPTSFNIAYTTHDNTKLFYPLENLNFYHTDSTGMNYGFSTIAKVNFESVRNNGIGAFEWSGNFGTFPANLRVECAFVMVPKNENGSSSLQDVIDVIEDQYSGDPGSSFPVDDIITQHNEKMGVLSFSSDALMQVLGLLSPDQTLSSELVFPSMSLTIVGQRNKVQLWPEYRFDLNTLKQHWPDFVELMQSLTSALVWIFVLRYCYRVFEKYFLAGGGS